MLQIKNNDIYLTRGDTLTLTVGITKDGEPYDMQDGDSVRFALSKGYVGLKGYQLIMTKPVPADTLTFTLSSAETQSLDSDRYNYDIQMTYANGEVDTFISAKLMMMGEVE